MLVTVARERVWCGKTMEDQLAGHWSMQAAPNQVPGSIAMTLNRDRSFRIEWSRSGATTASVSGTWVLTRARTLGISIEHVAQGDASVVGKRMGIGTVKSIDDRQLVLETEKAREVYARVR